jgi:sugar-specific transcriptional regulator TrmB
MRIETLLKTNINAVANLQNEMELLKDMIESSLTWDWKMTGQKQVTSNWIDVTREAEKWKNGNKTDNLYSHFRRSFAVWQWTHFPARRCLM